MVARGSRGSASALASAPGGRVVLGISCDFHDAAAAIVVDGEVVAAAEEERFSRRKHDASLPTQATRSCLAIAGLEAEDIDVVAFYERPMMVLHRYLAARQRSGPAGWARFGVDAPRLIGTNLPVAYRIERMLRRSGRRTPVPVWFCDHHASHAAAAFYPSPFERAAVLTLDGIGEWATASIARGHGRHLEVVEELRYPDSLGLLYSYVTSYCGFRPNADEYKLMGLAPFGSPRFTEALRELVDVHPDGSPSIRARAVGWFATAPGRGRTHHRRFDGPPRRPEDPITDREADLAASVQVLLQDAVQRAAERAVERTGERSLCLAGGVALNCVANGRLAASGAVDDLWVQPAAGDAGSALGAALAVWHQGWSRPRTAASPDGMRGAFLGPRARTDELQSWLHDHDLPHRWVPDPADRAALVADRLAAGDIVGWCCGAMEFGPRALGHRSILADARSPTVRRELNRRVKGREDFRPFAPAVLAEHAEEWFDLPVSSPYMLVTAPVRAQHRVWPEQEPTSIEARAEAVRSTIPACTHVDGSARVQTVDAVRNPELHALLAAFHERTGCPILLNTSFNRSEEPIVATPTDALRTALAAGLDLLVIDEAIIALPLEDGRPASEAVGDRRG